MRWLVGGFLSGDLYSPLDDLLLSFSPRKRPLAVVLPTAVDGEERRRPVYTRLVSEGFPPGIACDDGAAAVYRDAELLEVVADRDGAHGYKVSAAGVEAIETRFLG